MAYGGVWFPPRVRERAPIPRSWESVDHFSGESSRGGTRSAASDIFYPGSLPRHLSLSQLPDRALQRILLHKASSGPLETVGFAAACHTLKDVYAAGLVQLSLRGSTLAPQHWNLAVACQRAHLQAVSGLLEIRLRVVRIRVVIAWPHGGWRPKAARILLMARFVNMRLGPHPVPVCQGIDPLFCRVRALFFASRMGHELLVKKLLSHGASANNVGWDDCCRISNARASYRSTAHARPRIPRHRPMSALLVAINPDKYYTRDPGRLEQDRQMAPAPGCTNINDASGLIQSLLRWKADPNVANCDGCSALHLAALAAMRHSLAGCSEHPSIDSLLDSRADVNIPTDVGGSKGTVFFLACREACGCCHTEARSGPLALLAKLLKAWADINAMCDGESPLHLAVKNASIDVMQLLLSAKADVHASMNPEASLVQDSELPIAGCTALHLAGLTIRSPLLANPCGAGRSNLTLLSKLNKCREMVCALLNSSADPSCLNHSRQTALDYLPSSNSLDQSTGCALDDVRRMLAPVATDRARPGATEDGDALLSELLVRYPSSSSGRWKAIQAEFNRRAQTRHDNVLWFKNRAHKLRRQLDNMHYVV